MLRERSFGAVIYRKENNKILYLLLLYEKGYWDFPKGHSESGESPVDTMVREIREETGLGKIDVASGFKEEINYMFRNAGELVSKDVTFFLVKSEDKDVTISSEHKDAKWAEYEEAMEMIKFQNSKEVLKKARDFLSAGGAFFQKKLA